VGKNQLMWLAADFSSLMIQIGFMHGLHDMSKKGSQVYLFVRGADGNLLFPPHAQNVEEAQHDINALLACDPAQHGVSRTRWTLETLLQKIQQKGYALSKVGSLHRFLFRLGIRRNQARYSYRSPDKQYQEKLVYIENIVKRVKESKGKELLFYLDEFSYYRQPLLAKTWTRSDQKQEKVKRAHAADTRTRVLGVINAANGRVHYFQAPKISVADTVSFYKKLREAYPEAERLWIVQDTNPVHFHPNLRVALEEQETPFPMILPPNWSTEPKKWAIDRFQKWHLPIQLVQLPTYAPWCNPIEKLWRKFRQDFGHLHRFCEDIEEYRAKARQFFDRFAQGSAELLQYVGLGVPY